MGGGANTGPIALSHIETLRSRVPSLLRSSLIVGGCRRLRLCVLVLCHLLVRPCFRLRVLRRRRRGGLILHGWLLSSWCRARLRECGDRQSQRSHQRQNEISCLSPSGFYLSFPGRSRFAGGAERDLSLNPERQMTAGGRQRKPKPISTTPLRSLAGCACRSDEEPGVPTKSHCPGRLLGEALWQQGPGMPRNLLVLLRG
jgi:hypothetical protein